MLLVEDDPFTRSTLRGALSQEGFLLPDPAANAKEALSSFKMHDHDALLLDLDLGGGPTGLDVALLIRKIKPRVALVFLTSFEDPRLHSNSHKRLPDGAAYLVKQSVLDVRQISNAVRQAISDASDSTRKSLVAPSVAFTDVQLETMRLVAAGMTNSDIAKARFVSEKTVEKTIKLIADQLNLAPAPNTNVRVAIARTYLKLTGGKG